MKKLIKNITLSLLSATVLVTPIAVISSCSSSNQDTNKQQNNNQNNEISFKNNNYFTISDNIPLINNIDTNWIKQKVIELKSAIFNIPPTLENGFDWNSNINILNVNKSNNIILFDLLLNENGLSKRITFDLNINYNIALNQNEFSLDENNNNIKVQSTINCDQPNLKYEYNWYYEYNDTNKNKIENANNSYLNIDLSKTTKTTSFKLYLKVNLGNNYKFSDPITVNLNNTYLNENLMNFSMNNSFQLAMQSSDPMPEYNNLPLCSTGTAWSFYHYQNQNEYVWYLFTNYHVLEPTLAYFNSINNNKSTLRIYDKSNNLNNHLYFTLNKYNLNSSTPAYESLLINDYYNYQCTDWSLVNYIDLINDNEVKNFDLFSNDDVTTNKHYNIDIGILKISFSKKPNFLNDNISAQIANPFLNYLNDKKTNDINNLLNVTKIPDANNSYYIAGNPNSTKKLTFDLEAKNKYIQYRELNMSYANTTFYFAPVKYPDDQLIENSQWPLQPGASGSAIYVINNSKDSLLNNIPVGVYVGTLGNAKIAPCFIPFIYQNPDGYSYNVFENFNFLLNNHQI